MLARNRTSYDEATRLVAPVLEISAINRVASWNPYILGCALTAQFAQREKSAEVST